MNILFINSARTWGGTEKWTFMAAHALAEEHNTFLVYRRPVVGNRFSVPKFQLPCLSHIDPYTIAKVISLVRQHHIDVIIPTKRKDYLIAGIAAKICGITNILRLGIDRTPSGFWFHRIMYGSLAHGIIVNARKTKESLLRAPWIKPDHVRVIYNGIDTETINRQFPFTITDKPDGFTICSMGILSRRKGFDFLIQGFARFLVLSKAPDARLVIIGNGPELARLTSLASELDLSHYIRFTGFLDNPLTELARSHLFAMVSKNEGIANALLEGMFLGNAPVSTRAGGAEEVIDDNSNGYLLDFGDIDALAEAFLSLYQCPSKRIDFAEKARKRVLNQFSMTRMKDEIAGYCLETARRPTESLTKN
jgi:glycosyltransferase involved in cell wall biosynthesis